MWKKVIYEDVSRSFRIGRLEREPKMVQLSATRFSCITILWVSLVSFAAVTLCVASQRVFIIVVVYFVIYSVRKLLDTPSYPSIRFGGLRNITETCQDSRFPGRDSKLRLPKYWVRILINQLWRYFVVRFKRVARKLTMLLVFTNAWGGGG
jgi:hypothetical protein